MESIYIELIQWRAIERLLSVLIGGGSIAAGWHLFLKGVVQEQSADISAQNLKISLQKVGPGVFFALFGALVIIYISTSQVSIENMEQPISKDASKVGSAVNRIAFISSGEDSWAIKFVAATNTLGKNQELINEILATLASDNSEDSRYIKGALSELMIARKKFLIEYFPPELLDVCKRGSPAPRDFNRDSCILYNEFEKAELNFQ